MPYIISANFVKSYFESETVYIKRNDVLLQAAWVLIIIWGDQLVNKLTGVPSMDWNVSLIDLISLEAI